VTWAHLLRYDLRYDITAASLFHLPRMHVKVCWSLDVGSVPLNSELEANMVMIEKQLTPPESMMSLCAINRRTHTGETVGSQCCYETCSRHVVNAAQS